MSNLITYPMIVRGCMLFHEILSSRNGQKTDKNHNLLKKIWRRELEPII